MATVRKKVDNRIRVQIENGVALQHRTMFVVVGDRGRDQVCFCLLLQSRHIFIEPPIPIQSNNERLLCWPSRWLYFIICCPKLLWELGLLSYGATKKTWDSAGRRNLIYCDTFGLKYRGLEVSLLALAAIGRNAWNSCRRKSKQGR